MAQILLLTNIDDNKVWLEKNTPEQFWYDTRDQAMARGQLLVDKKEYSGYEVMELNAFIQVMFDAHYNSLNVRGSTHERK